jgi:hypothetical protein
MIDVDRAQRTGQLEIVISEDAYASEGALNVEAMLSASGPSAPASARS